MAVRIRREDLYAEVWKTPLRHLAPKYGLSDVGLAKVCDRLDVPRPPQGHWARVAAGHEIEPTPLPDLEAGARPFVDVEPNPPPPKRPEAPDIPVAERLTKPHPLVEQTRKAVKEAGTNEHGLLWPPKNAALTAEVSKGQLDRALRFLDALIKGLEARGHNVRTEVGGDYRYPHGRARTTVTVSSEPFRLRLREHLHRSENPPQKADSFWSHHPRYTFSPSGRFDLEADAVNGYGRRRWSDGARRRLDRSVGRIIVDLEVAAESVKEHRREREEEEQRRAEGARRAEEARRRRAFEEDLGGDLEDMAERLERAARVRQFLDAFLEQVGPIEEGSEAAMWVEWARGYADDLDPLQHPARIPKRLHPPEGWNPPSEPSRWWR